MLEGRTGGLSYRPLPHDPLSGRPLLRNLRLNPSKRCQREAGLKNLSGGSGCHWSGQRPGSDAVTTSQSTMDASLVTR